MHKQEKAKLGRVLLDDRNNHTPLEETLLEQTSQKVKKVIGDLYEGSFIDEMTLTWLSQTPNSPSVPVLRFHKDTQTNTIIRKRWTYWTNIIIRWPHTSANLNSLITKVLPQGYNGLYKFHRKGIPPRGHFLVSLDLTRPYTSIPQEGIETVCRAFENVYRDNTPIPTLSLKEMRKLILQENSFEFKN